MMYKFNLLSGLSLIGLVFGVLGLPMSAGAQAAGGGASGGSLVSGLFGEKEDLDLKDAINYDQCFEYKQGFSIGFSGKCKKNGKHFPVFKYKATHTEPTAIVELTMDPGGGAIKNASSGAGGLSGQGLLKKVATSGGGASGGGLSGLLGKTPGAKAYTGPQNPNMPTMGKIPNTYFDAHVWGVGPLGLLEAAKGGAENQGGGRMNGLKSMICWIADASTHWAPIPGDASAHLALISPVAEPYLGHFLGDWGNTWYNQAGSSEVSATTANRFTNGFGDSSAFGLAALGALAGFALASGDEEEKCRIKEIVDEKKEEAEFAAAEADKNKDDLGNMARRATYLPAGFDQLNVGYDTCPLTGVGHFIDEKTGEIGFNNCDPQERTIKINCDTGQSQFVSEFGLGGGRGGENSGGQQISIIPMDPYKDPCAGRSGRSGFRGGGEGGAQENAVYVKAPSCHNRLSAFNENGKYLACNSSSRTFTSCSSSVSGSAQMIPGHPSGKSGNQAANFTLCTRPSGQKIVNQLDVFNRELGEKINQTSEDFLTGVSVIEEELEKDLQNNQVSCNNSGGGGGSGAGLKGAALGAGAGFAVSKGLEAVKSGKISLPGLGGGGLGNISLPSIGGGNLGGIGNAFSGVGDAFGGITDKISGAINGGAISEQFKGITDGFKTSFGGISDQISGITDGVKGTLGSITQGAGLGSLSSVTNKAGALMAADGSINSVTNIASEFDVMPEWLGASVSMFNQEKIIPLYLTEDNREDWRSENPIAQSARMTAMQKVPLASTAGAFSNNLADETCGKVGVWGQLCPLRGFVETSGDNFPASGLAGWRAYQKALPKIPDRKRMQNKPTEFNLDYPHQSACHEIGVDPSEWESRREQTGGGLVGRLFGGAAGGLSSIFSAGNPEAGLGGMFGKVDDTRAETGVFVYTYWKNTKCKWDVCTAPNAMVGLGNLAGLPGLEGISAISEGVGALSGGIPDVGSLGSVGESLSKASFGDGALGQAANSVKDGVSSIGKSFGNTGLGQAAKSLKDGATSASKAASGAVGKATSSLGIGGGAATKAVGDKAKGVASNLPAAKALENIPQAEALKDMVGNLAPANLPKLGQLGKIIKFKSQE